VTSIAIDTGDGNDHVGITGINPLGAPMTVSAGPGDDDIAGGDAADALDGGAGDDEIIAGPGDVVHGGSGIDVVKPWFGWNVAGQFSLDGASADVENAEFGGNGPATIVGSGAANELTGSDGPDTLTGLAGADVLTGHGGDDLLSARDAEQDRVDCGAGNDVAIVDQYDQVGDSCETVQRADIRQPLEDRAPTVAWSRSRPAGALRLRATDDRGVRQVQVLDGGRLICTDKRAPFTCPRPKGAGRHVLLAIATDASGQTASAVRALRIQHPKPRARRSTRAGATLVNRDGTLTFSGAGSRSDLTFAGGPTVTVTRNAPVGPIEGGGPVLTAELIWSPAGDADPFAATGCSPVADPKFPALEQFTCEGVKAVVADTGAGDDIVHATGLTVPLTGEGGEGDDWLNGGAADDSLSGGPGSDKLFFAGAGRDALDGGPGEDIVVGGPGDTVNGGSGIDAGYYAGTAPATILLDTGVAGFSPDVEDIIGRAPAGPLPEFIAPVTLRGTNAANRLVGGRGNDHIDGGLGADTLIGGAGDDVISARDGVADRITCGDGADTAIVDALDQVGDSCETVQVGPAGFGLEDRPPTAAWKRPAGGRLAQGRTTALAVEAGDDRGVRRVRFLADDRVLCTVTAAPFSCSYRPRERDVGAHTLIAVVTDSAGQTTTIVRRITVVEARSRRPGARQVRGRT
jgi:Ca2+-binding RTX toxin-like protein